MSNNEHNILLSNDFYKHFHHEQYDSNIKNTHFHFLSRSDNVLFFGLQYYLKKYLAGKVITQEKIDETCCLISRMCPEKYNLRKKLNNLLKDYDGFLPIRIYANDEGHVYKKGTPLFSVEATDDKYYWLPGFLESMLCQVWYPCTVATNSYNLYKLLKEYYVVNTEQKIHDFGVRGTTCQEQAGIGGAAHLITFNSTDNLPAVNLVKKYYSEEVDCFSVPASEHSTVTSFEERNECYAYKKMFSLYRSGSVFSLVVDSYNQDNALKRILKIPLNNNDIKTVVLRLDSGEPCENIIHVLELLLNNNVAIEEKRSKILFKKFRILQGDGVNYKTINSILETVKNSKFSIENIIFGSGGYLLNSFNRDTYSFKYAMSAIYKTSKDIDNSELEWVGVSKRPSTDTTKKTIKGRFTDKTHLLMTKVFENGELCKSSSFSDLKERIESYVK